MAKLVWDQLGAKTYETGVKKGVLYLQSGSAQSGYSYPSGVA